MEMLVDNLLANVRGTFGRQIHYQYKAGCRDTNGLELPLASRRGPQEPLDDESLDPCSMLVLQN